jgi:hypothetical protein
VTVPVGDTVVGAAGGPGGGVPVLTINVMPMLIALVPEALLALKYHVYVVPLVSVVVGVIEHVPVPAAHPTWVAVYDVLITVPAVLCTSSMYEVAPADAFHT